MRALILVAMALASTVANAQVQPYRVSVRFYSPAPRGSSDTASAARFTKGLETDGALTVTADQPTVLVAANLFPTRSGYQLFVYVSDPATRRSLNPVGYTMRGDSLLAGVEAAGRETARHITRALTTANRDSAWRPGPQPGVKSIMPLFGFHAGSPARYSLALGAAYTERADLKGPFVAVEAGQRAGRASLGRAWVSGEFATGLNLRASFLRVYSGRPTANYAGVEGQIWIMTLGFRLGAFLPLRGSHGLIGTDFSLGI